MEINPLPTSLTSPGPRGHFVPWVWASGFCLAPQGGGQSALTIVKFLPTFETSAKTELPGDNWQTQSSSCPVWGHVWSKCPGPIPP